MNGFAGKFGFVLLGEGGREGGSGEGEMPRITKGIRTLKMFCSNHWLGGFWFLHFLSVCWEAEDFWWFCVYSQSPTLFPPGTFLLGDVEGGITVNTELKSYCSGAIMLRALSGNCH